MEVYRATLAEDDVAFAQVHHSLALTLLEVDRIEEAEAEARSAERILDRTYPEGHRRLGNSRVTLGRCLIELQRYEEAEPLLLSSMEMLEKGYGPDSRAVTSAINSIVTLYTAWDRPREAEVWLARLPGPPADGDERPDD